jgi:hypothetical protein
MATAPTQDFIVKSGLNVQGTSTVTSSTGNTSTLQVDGGAAIAKNLIVGDDTIIYGDLTVYGNIPNLTITTGTFTDLTVSNLSTLNVVTAGVTTASQLTVTTRLAVGGLSELNNATLSNQTNSTSSTTGALQVSGGVGIQKDLWVGGNAYVNGFQVLTTASIDLSTLQTATEKGSSTTVAISVLNTTSSTSTNSGALTVTGGVGIGGDLYANALYINTASYINNSLVITTATVDLYATKTSILAGTDTAVNTSTGIVTIWNTSTLQSVTNRGSTTTNAVVITNTQSSTSTVAGNALQVSGGVGVGSSLYIGGRLGIKNTAITAGIDSVAGWAYDSTFSVANPVEIFFKSDGLRMYVATATVITQYDLSVAWDITTAVAGSTFVMSSIDASTLGLFISPDGTKMITCGNTGVVIANGSDVASQDRAYYFTLGTPWDVSSATLVSSIRFAIGDAGGIPAAMTAPQAVDFNNDGTIMYIQDSTTDAVHQFALSSAYNVGTAIWTKQFSVVGQESGGTGLRFNSSGTRMYVYGSTGDDVNEYRLSTAWDIATAVFYDKFYTGWFEATPNGIYINESANVAFLCGSSSDVVLKFHTDRQGVEIDPETPTSKIELAGNTRVVDNFNVQGQSLLEGLVTTVGSLSVGSDITVGGNDLNVGSATAAASLFSGLTSGALSIATSETTGAITVGGTAATGVITVGQSTAAQTLNLSSGATAAGSIKVINIGTAGLAGSTSTINIGSTASGALGVITIGGTQTIIVSTTSAVSTSTGALQVRGGVGISQNLYVGGTIYGTLIGSGSISTASNLASGTAGQVPYQTAPGVTSFYGPGTAGNVLVSNGTGAPTYNNTLTLTSTLSNTTTVAGNALQVVGGVGISGSLFVDGPAYFANNVIFYGTSTSIFSTATVYTDNYIDLHYPSGPSGEGGVWTVDDGKDIGHIYHHYKTPTGDEHGALIWHNASDELRWYMGGVNYVPVDQSWDISTATFGVFRTGTIQLQNNISATSTTTGTLVVVGGVGVGGGLYVGGISTFTSLLIASAGVQTTNIVANGTLGVTGTSILAGVQATNIVASGTLGVTGTSTLGVLNAGSATFSGTLGVTGTSVLAGLTSITNTTSATSTLTGALVVSGGAGIGGDLYIGGTIYGTIVGSISTASNIAGGTAGQVPYQTAPGITGFYGPGTAGNVLVSNGTGAPTYNNTLTLAGTTAATSTNTGALKVIGGVGIGGNLFVGGSTSSFSGNVGVGTASPIWKVDVNLGSITSPSISTGGYNVTGDATSSVGYTTYNLQLNNSTANASGYMRLARTGGTAYLGMQIGSQSRDGIAFLTGATTATEQVRISAVGIVTVSTTTNATSTATGALQVIGGVGIGGNLYVGGISVLSGVQATNIVASGTLGVTGTSTLGVLNATSATFSGTLGVTGTSVLAGLTSITNTTSATSTATGALVVYGGVGIGGALYVKETSYINGAQILTTATIGSFGVTTITAGTDTVVTTSTGAVLIYNTSTLQSVTDRGAATTNAVSITNTTTSISTTTGALQVRGGVGVGGSVYVGNRVGFVGTNSASVVYQVYNAATNSLDTVFG